MNYPRTVVIVNDFDYIEGGASKVALMTAADLVSKGHKVYFFSGASDSKVSKVAGVEYISTDQYPALKDPNKIRGFFNGVYNFKAASAFKKLLRSLNIKDTCIHIHTWTKVLSCSIWSVADKMGFKVYLTCHDYFTVCPNGGFFNYPQNCICHERPLSTRCVFCNCDSRNYFIKLYRCVRTFIQNRVVKIFEKTDTIITISNFSQNILQPFFPPKVKVVRVDNPIDKPPSDIKITPEKNEYFLFVGRLSKEKGCELFCKAISELGLRGVIVGDGPEMAYLKKMYPALTYTGWKSRKEVFEYMQNARALIFSSIWYETAGLSVLEALSIGLPCIVSKTCAASDFIKDGENGLLFLGVESLKKKILQLAKNLGSKKEDSKIFSERESE